MGSYYKENKRRLYFIDYFQNLTYIKQAQDSTRT